MSVDLQVDQPVVSVAPVWRVAQSEYYFVRALIAALLLRLVLAFGAGGLLGNSGSIASVVVALLPWALLAISAVLLTTYVKYGDIGVIWAANRLRR